MTVLIVEDHREMAHWMEMEIRHAGWDVRLGYTARDAEEQVRRAAFDVILIDIGLPDEDGISLCRRLRGLTTASLIMVTARQELRDRVNALDSGADDYLAKPFMIEELMARMRAVVRRARHERGPVLEVGDVRIWPDERRVERRGEEVKMGRREFDLLHALMDGQRRVHTREDLLERVWGYDFEGESNVVDVTIRRLREHLGEDALTQIRSVRGVGYTLQVGE